MSLTHSHSPKINPTEQTPQSGLHHHENSHLAESAYITSEYQKTAQTPTTQRVGYDTHAKIESSSPNQHFDSSRFSTDDKNSYSAYSTAGLTSNLGSAALNYQYTSALPSTYGTSTSYSYQPSAKIEEYSKSLGNPEPATQSYSYSTYKRESASPTIKALNENTASLLGRSAAIENNFGKTSLTLQERYGLTPALSFGATNYSADLGLAKEEHKTSDNLKYSDYLKSKHTIQSFEYGKSPYEQTFGSTAGLAGEDTKKSGVQGLYSSTDYTDLINKISNKPAAEPKNDNYTILKPDSLTNTEKKQRQTVGSHYYQSTYPNTVRTPSESGRKDRYANSELSAAASPPFKRDKLEVSHQPEVVDDYVISDPHITKKTLYTIENSGSLSINGGKDFVNQLGGLHKTPERKIKSKSGSPSPFDDLKHALKNESVQISKIVIETVENYGGETEAHETHHHRNASEKFDIVMEQGARGSHHRTGSIKSPTNNVKIQRKLVEDSSSFKEPVHYNPHHSRKASDTSSSKVGGTITAINDRIKELDNVLNQGVRSSASKYQSLLSSNSKAESAGVHHRAPLQHHHHHEEDEKLRAKVDKEKEKEREKQEKERQKEMEKQEKERQKEREKQEKERQKQEKERQKKEQEEAKLKAKQAAAAAKESNKHNNPNSGGQFIVKLIIAFIVLLLLGVLSFELMLGNDEYDALLDTPLHQVLKN